MAQPATDGVPGLDLAAWARWFEGVAAGSLAGPVRARLLAGGKSNLTYEVSDGRHWWVVRRPPLGHVLATAHDMVREHTVITALAPTAVPVPATFGLCTDPDVIGAPFYVMERVPGVAYRRAAQLAPLGPERTAQLGERVVDVLAALHALDPAAVGLQGFGRPEGFLERQVRRWGRQLEGSRSRELAGARELHERLAARVPAQQATSVVHGDYRLDNLLVDEREEIRAVVDWEMSTLGDPLTDVALMVVYDALPDLGEAAIVADASRAPGYPGAAAVLERYAERSGRDLSQMGFYLGLGFFKLAVVLEGIHYRHSHGQTLGEGFDRVGDAVQPLLAAGLQALADP